MIFRPWNNLAAAVALLGLSSVLGASAAAQAPGGGAGPDGFPAYSDVIQGYEKVVSTIDGAPSLYTIWIRKKDQQLLAELPKDWASAKQYFALTVASGETYAGLQAGEHYLYWRMYDKRLALIEPNVEIRSTGEQESKDSVKRLFTDRVVLDVPILTLTPQKVPVIDLDALLLEQAGKFFPSGEVRGANSRLATIKTAKAFPENVELGFELPMADGRLKTLHYSISRIPDSTGYTPREADLRVGYFTTSFTDLGKYTEDDKQVRYINRWHLEKADPSLKLSPPKNPIVFYIEHTTPRRYRYWVKQGVLQWNEAFERIGIRDAVVVYQQDADPKNPTHMEKDPEDVRYNFIRWLNNDIGTAIGPSRVHPLTGQILDADIILTDGWIRYYERQFSEVLPKLAMEGFSPQTLAWLHSNPRWDPRIRLAPPSQRAMLIAERAGQAAQPHGGHPAALVDPTLLGDDEYDGLIGRISQVNGMCLAAEGKAMELTMLRMTLDMLTQELAAAEEQEEGAKDEKEGEDGKKDEEKKDEPKKEEEQKLDGVPESFMGPLIAELVAHEVGHTLGLRHNFKASSIYTLDEINGEQGKQRQLAGSVMDYLPINMPDEQGKPHGAYSMTGVGPYDLWAIEYGYSLEKDLKPVLARVAEPELVYGTDEDTWGPDPRARRYDFSQNPLDYAKSQIRLANNHRARLLKDFVKDGESWSKARRGYEMTLAFQMRANSMMANWIGGTFLSRDRKGDKNGRQPLQVVPVERQREALDFVIENSFRDEAYGLTPELMQHLATDMWLDQRSLRTDADWPVHDRIMGLQASVMTMLMNPDTLRLVYDNELRTPADQDMLTLPEMLGKISSAAWTELEKPPAEKCSDRKPWISSLRRNLQREHLERLIDLAGPDAGLTAAYKPISNLALTQLRSLKDRIANVLKQQDKLDAYSVAHLSEAQLRIETVLDPQYIYNVPTSSPPRLTLPAGHPVTPPAR
ncbi:MAG: zinc-dependent metalloprotease [Pirellulaceae bacterium]|nr:zinc-dependent metalloprotease [Pirellulaceae bacterium]